MSKPHRKTVRFQILVSKSRNERVMPSSIVSGSSDERWVLDSMFDLFYWVLKLDLRGLMPGLYIGDAEMVMTGWGDDPFFDFNECDLDLYAENFKLATIEEIASFYHRGGNKNA